MWSENWKWNKKAIHSSCYYTRKDRFNYQQQRSVKKKKIIHNVSTNVHESRFLRCLLFETCINYTDYAKNGLGRKEQQQEMYYILHHQ